MLCDIFDGFVRHFPFASQISDEEAPAIAGILVLWQTEGVVDCEFDVGVRNGDFHVVRAMPEPDAGRYRCHGEVQRR